MPVSPKHPGHKNDGPREFTLPRIWPDWVLALDDAGAGYPTPGSAKCA